MPRSQAAYVIIRKDLSRSQQAVQGGHALAQLLKEHENSWSNGTLVYLTVPNETELEKMYLELVKSKHQVSKFEEEDRNDEMTAIATYGDNINISISKFPNLKLL